jgi:hypothetical protein
LRRRNMRGKLSIISAKPLCRRSVFEQRSNSSKTLGRENV